ncbi:hypothetical protein [Methylobacterium nodulans]|uniref:Uncharacterized protein n=1 Tax=Methylobacterium nodulans (strain LMG 21967 / CNCM I-2342 / ORS 2060) TaxID=460265 RepID=B8IBI4_METNO|nr:hypothetical protein [Methylobacterium nodulans]ACL59238.1 conserved hypothetical protein [Methylobacterium nodulans ORS 2060]
MTALFLLGFVAIAANALLAVFAADRLTPEVAALPLVAGNENEVAAARLAA